MKRHIKKIITIALCMSIMQPTLQATPFGEFCRKWAAPGAALLYWNAIAGPASTAFFEWNGLHEQEESGDLNFFPNLKKYDPVKFLEAEKILKDEGFQGFDNHTLKVVPIEQVGFPTALVKKKILFPDTNHYSSPENAASVMALSNLDSGELAAIFRHEQEHQIHNHNEKKLLLKAIAPFGIHAIAKGIYNKMVTIKSHSDVPPTIKRSLLRIPQAYAVVAAASCIENWYSRVCEREADASLKNSSKLALHMAGWMNKFELQQRAALESRMKQLYPEEVTKYIMQHYETLHLFHSHPSESKRIKYLEQWAKEAEAKKQQK